MTVASSRKWLTSSTNRTIETIITIYFSWFHLSGITCTLCIFTPATPSSIVAPIACRIIFRPAFHRWRRTCCRSFIRIPILCYFFYICIAIRFYFICSPIWPVWPNRIRKTYYFRTIFFRKSTSCQIISFYPQSTNFCDSCCSAIF